MSSNRRTFLTMGAATAASSWSACLNPKQQRQDTLLRLSREFNNDVRWARYDMAAAQFSSLEATRFLKRVDLVAEELVIADHEMTSIKFEEPSDKAKTIVVFEWYTKREPVVRKTSVVQVWAFEEGSWRLESQTRLRGPRFPLVPEAPKEDAPELGPSNEDAPKSGASDTQAVQPE